MIAHAGQTPTVEPAEARELILAGKLRGRHAEAGLHVNGTLDLSGEQQLTALPLGLKCFELNASETSLTTLPDDLQVDCGITLQNCRYLESLPAKLRTGTLDLQGCISLASLPEGLNVWFLNVSQCSSLQKFPKKATIENGDLNVGGCVNLAGLPNYLKRLATLDLRDCPQLDKVPKQLRLGLWIDVGGSGLTSLPESLGEVGIRWRGVPVTEQIAFRPDEITAKMSLAEKNAERRRVMIERMGFDRFMRDAGAKRIDKDKDPGGERELLLLPLENDEDIVSLSCFCPSTGRHYLLRVPPDTKTCHQAAAWIAGYDDPKMYKPVMET